MKPQWLVMGRRPWPASQERDWMWFIKKTIKESMKPINKWTKWMGWLSGIEGLINEWSEMNGMKGNWFVGMKWKQSKPANGMNELSGAPRQFKLPRQAEMESNKRNGNEISFVDGIEGSWLKRYWICWLWAGGSSTALPFRSSKTFSFFFSSASLLYSLFH